MITRRHLLGQMVAGAAIAPVLTFGQEQKVVPDSLKRVAEGSQVAATVHSVASQGSIEIMRKGGNAIDAAIAAAVCLSVVDGHNSGIGGGV